jgi:hypothetical protein
MNLDIYNDEHQAMLMSTPNRYEVFIRQSDVILFLRTLDIGNKKMDKNSGNTSLFVNDRALLYIQFNIDRPSMLCAAHCLNQVFVAGRMPYYAKPSGDHKIRIGRISEKFDPSQYASVEGCKLRGKDESSSYEEPNRMVYVRVKTWLNEIGIDFEALPASEKEVAIEISKIYDEVKCRDRTLYKEFEYQFLLQKEEEES